MQSSPSRIDGARVASAVVAVLAAAGFAALYVVAVGSERGQRWEDRALAAADFPGSWFGLLDLITPVTIAVVVALCVVVALARRRVGLALRAVAIVGVPTVLSQILKHGILDRPELTASAAENSYPSGHAVASLALVLAVVTVLPRGARPVVALLASPVVAVIAVQLLEYGWHRLSDVLGAVLLVGAAAAAARAVWPDRQAPRAGGAERALRWLMLAGSAGAIAIAVGIVAVYGIGRVYRDDLLLVATELVAAGVVVAVVAIAAMPWRRGASVTRAAGRQRVAVAA